MELEKTAPGESEEFMESGESGSLPEGQSQVLEAVEGDSDQDKAEVRATLQRVQADFMNYKRRSDEERQEQQKYSNSRLILKLLPLVDEFSLAIDHAAKTEAAESWLEGIRLLHRKLYSLLESENVTRIEVQGSEFDPYQHEAMAYQESTEYKEGEIVSVVREGYKLHDRLLRPALVILARIPEEATTSPSTEEEKGNG